MTADELAEVLSLEELRARRAARSQRATNARESASEDATAPAQEPNPPIDRQPPASSGGSPNMVSAWVMPELSSEAPCEAEPPETSSSASPSEEMCEAWGQRARRMPVEGPRDGSVAEAPPGLEPAPARGLGRGRAPSSASTRAPAPPAAILPLAELASRRGTSKNADGGPVPDAAPGFAAAWTAQGETVGRRATGPSAGAVRSLPASPDAAARAEDSAEARLARAAEAVAHADAVERAVVAAQERALAMLRRSDRSSGELRRALAEDELLGEAEIERILERLGELGYLDDARLAEHLVEKHLVRQGKGRMAVERLLRGKGIPAEAIDAALAEHDRDDEFERARETATDRARRLRGLDEETATRRLVSFLQRRGFTSGVAYRAAQDALGMPSGRAAGASASGVRFVPSDELG